MLKIIKIFREAKRVVDIAQKKAINKETSDKRIEDDNLGFHLSFDPNENEQRFEKLKFQMGRSFPYRIEEKGGMLTVIIPGEPPLFSSGNELENNINEKKLTPEQWQREAVALYREFDGDTKQLGSPALMTLKQAKDFWPNIINCENYFDYWCLNSHIPGFIRRKESGIGDYIEIIKTVAELIKFRNATTKPIIFTELGNGEYHYAVTRADVNMLYWIHKLIFQNRMVCGLFYNDGLMSYNNGIDQLRKR